MSAGAAYWLISSPSYRAAGEPRHKDEKISTEELKRLEKNTRDRLDKATHGYTTNYPFKIPLLKVGTIGKLMAVCDKLAKADTVVEGIVKKIERAFYDFCKTPNEEAEGKSEGKEEVKGQQETPELKVERKSLDKSKPESEYLTAREYLERFQWDVSRYNTKRELTELVDTILEAAHRSDEKLRKQTTEYTEVKQGLLAIERRETGTLLVKPLGPFVSGENAKYIIEKEFLTTLLVVVPKAKEKNFLEEYETLEEAAAERARQEKERKDAETAARAAKKEKEDQEKQEKKDKHKHDKDKAKDKEGDERKKPMSPKEGDERKKPVEEEGKEGKEAKKREEDKKNMSGPELEAAAEAKRREEGKPTCKNVVPRSAVRLTPPDYEGEFVLYRIVVFKKGADTIKHLCREARYTVRPFAYDPREEQEAASEKKRLLKDRKKLYGFLVRFAKTQYSDIFSAWIHLKAMRVFAESVLRFGLPVDYHATLIEPKKGKEQKLRAILKDLYKDLPNAALAESIEGEQDLSGFGAEFYPYIYFGINPNAA
jgi:hypothetical protein